MQDKINQLTEKIKSANSIAILMHINPDGDAVGSGIGLREIIRDNFGKDSTLIYPGKYDFVLDFVPGTSDMIHIDDFKMTDPFDLVIALDTTGLDRLTGCEDIFNTAHDTVKIDHHDMTDDFANLNINMHIPSTAEIIYKIARDAGWKMNNNAVTALFTGITTDTGFFRFIHDEGTFLILSDLVKMGARPNYILDQLTMDRKNSVLVNADAISKSKFYFNDTLAIASFAADDFVRADKNDGLALRTLRGIDTIEYTVILKETTDGTVRISLRSRNNPINHIAAQLNGGGHVNAAGGQITGTLDEAADAVLKLFETELGEKR